MDSRFKIQDLRLKNSIVFAKLNITKHRINPLMVKFPSANGVQIDKKINTTCA